MTDAVFGLMVVWSGEREAFQRGRRLSGSLLNCSSPAKTSVELADEKREEEELAWNAPKLKRAGSFILAF